MKRLAHYVQAYSFKGIRNALVPDKIVVGFEH